MEKKPPPKTLYKFRNWSDPNHQKLLTERQLWVPHAHDLNDPFDGCIPLAYDLMPREYHINKAKSVYLRNYPQMSQTAALAKAQTWANELGLNDPSNFKRWLAEFAQSYKIDLGALSFARHRHNPLLWSHYADGHKGFCLGVDSRKMEAGLKNLFKEKEIVAKGAWIKYEKDYPRVSPPSNDDELLDQFFDLLKTKSDLWEYEKEYRYMFPGNYDFPLCIDASCVTEIIRGAEMSDGDKLVIRLLAQEQFPEAKLLQAKAKPFSFELEFVPVVDD